MLHSVLANRLDPEKGALAKNTQLYLGVISKRRRAQMGRRAFFCTIKLFRVKEIPRRYLLN
jgi:hypothetical protein